MTPETAVVISAAISGGVAVCSVALSAWREISGDRQRAGREDRHRSEDRAWSLRLHNHQERRELYRELVAAASEGSTALVVMEASFRTLPADADRFDLSTRATERQRVNEAIARLAEAASAADVASYDRDVLDLTLTFRQTAGKAIASIVFRDTEPTEVLKQISQLMHELRDACRRDLGFDLTGDNAVSRDDEPPSE